MVSLPAGLLLPVISIKPASLRLYLLSLLSHVMLIECLPHENFDNRLPADVELTGRDIQFIQHILGEVHINPQPIAFLEIELKSQRSTI